MKKARLPRAGEMPPQRGERRVLKQDLAVLNKQFDTLGKDWSQMKECLRDRRCSSKLHSVRNHANMENCQFLNFSQYSMNLLKFGCPCPRYISGELINTQYSFFVQFQEYVTNKHNPLCCVPLPFCLSAFCSRGSAAQLSARALSGLPT